MSLSRSFHTSLTAFFASAAPSFSLIQGTHKASYFQQVDLRAPASFSALRKPSECLNLFLSGAISWLCSTRFAQMGELLQFLWTRMFFTFSYSDVKSVAADLSAASSHILSPHPQGMDLSGRWPSRFFFFLPPDFWFPAFFCQFN